MNTRANTLPPTALLSSLSGLYPLEEFYALRDGSARIVEHDDAATLEWDPKVHPSEDVLIWAPVEATAIPEPQRTLLVHRTDMTSTLEKFYDEKLLVEVLSHHTHGQEYFREVVLRGEQSGRRVEFGAIKIMLDLFPFEARQEILRERQPLGRILTEFGVAFSSQPRAYLRLAADEFIRRTLNLQGRQYLYGRRNALLDPWNQPLAEIVEILPPA
jgi:chorismate-pyruvate lyase